MTKKVIRYIEEIKLRGYTCVPQVLSPTTVTKLLSLVEKFQTDGTGEGVSTNQALDKYVYHLQYCDKIFLDIITEWKDGLEILKPFLQDPYYKQLPSEEANFILGYYNARSSVGELPLHIDNYFPSEGFFPNSMQVIFSLNGQSEENGASRVVPGSHRFGSWPNRELSDLAQPLNCEPGDVIIWDSRLWHGAGSNTKGIDRWSLVATFRPWFMKQNFDPVLGMPEEIYNELNSQQKALCGFLSLPPSNQFDRVNLKQGYSSLEKNIKDYR